MRARIECGYSNFPRSSEKTICRRFGLRGFDTDTLENVGVEVGLTRERVRQIQVEALQQLKILIRREGLNRELLGEAV